MKTSLIDPAIVAEITSRNKKFGPGTFILGNEINFDSLPRITSGSLTLDVALGGGWVSNQWNEVYGDESAGKTAVALKTVADNQKRDPNFMTLWCAAEEFVPSYAEMLGCDLKRIVLCDSNAMEFVYQQMLDWGERRLVDLIVLDSLPSLVPQREDEHSMEDLQVGLAPLLTNKFFRMQNKATKRSLTEEDRPITGLIINQFRMQIGVMRGDPRTTPGGRGKNFTYFTRVELRRDEWIEDGDDRVGQTIKARIVKNKSYKPHRIASFDYYFDDCPPNRAGEYDSVKEVVSVGILYGVIERHGAYYQFAGEKWQGRAPLIDQLREDLTLRQQVSDEVMTIVAKNKGEKPQLPTGTRTIPRRKK